MITITEFLIGFAIFILSLIDLKYKKIPSFLSTSIILALILIQPQNLIWGLAGFLFGLVLYELDFSSGQYLGGIADIKVLAIIGFLIANLAQFATLMITVVGLGVIFALGRHFVYKGKAPKEFPFIPALFLAYCLMLAIREVFLK